MIQISPIIQNQNRVYFKNDLTAFSKVLGLTTINTLSIGRLSDYGLEKLHAYISTMLDNNVFQFTGEKYKLIKKSETINEVYSALKNIDVYMYGQQRKEGKKNHYLYRELKKSILHGI